MDKKKKVYIISGLGAGSNVFNRVDFGSSSEPVFIEWLQPKKKESLENYSLRMAESIKTDEPFYLVGYSFGGMIVQEINKHFPAIKVILLGSLKSSSEKSLFFKFLKLTRIYKIVPISFFTHKNFLSYAFFRKMYSRRLPDLFEYFTVRDPYYLKWSIHQVIQWKGKKQDNTLQILATKDLVFPIKHCRPEFVIQNATHLFPVTHYSKLSALLQKILI